MKTALGFIALGIVALLAGCHRQPVHSVRWYMAHDQERTAMLTKCKAMPAAQSMADENCAHVDAAIKQADKGAKPWRDMPMSPAKKR